MERYLNPQSLKLSLGASPLLSSHIVIFMTVILGLPVILIVLLWYSLLADPEAGADISELLNAFWRFLQDDPETKYLLWAAVLLLPLGVIALVGQSRASLRVTSIGLQGYIPKWLGHGLLGQTGCQWNLAWDDIRRVRLVDRSALLASHGRWLQHMRKLNTYRLVLETDTDEVRVHPFIWFDGSGEDHRLKLNEVFGSPRFDAGEVVARAPLMRALAARGFEIESTIEEPETQTAQFNLGRHRGMLVQMAVLFTAGFYALFDAFIIGQYRPLETPPALPFIVTAGVAVLAVRKLGRGAPRLERLCVGALTVAALTAAVYPAMLRINAMTAASRVVTYEATELGRFAARDEDLPAIVLKDRNMDEYLAQYPAGSEHEFTLLRGVAGFYQMDLFVLYAKTREFYSNKGKAGGKNE